MHVRPRAFLFLLFLLTLSLARCKAASDSGPNSGESLFKSHCSLCHGVDGHSKTTVGQQLQAADLHSQEVQDKSDAVLKQVILHGKGNMPPFEGQLTEVQVRNLLNYVRQFGKKPKPKQ